MSDNRCVRWCDKDAELSVTVVDAQPAATEVVVKFAVSNPPSHQTARPLYVSVTGPGLYIPPSEVSVGTPGVLSARTAPAMIDSAPDANDAMTISEESCPQTEQLSRDPDTNQWRGSCAGMINTIKIALNPNLELYPGARIVISGLTRSDGDKLPPPMVREIQDFTSVRGLSIEQWESTSGRLTLRVEARAGAHHAPVVPVGKSPSHALGTPTRFALEFQMPSRVNDADAANRDITLNVYGAGASLKCSFMTLVESDMPLLKAKNPSSFSFVDRKVGSSTCYAGECNTISVTFAPNRYVREGSGAFKIVITGLHGMRKSSTCNPASSCGDSDVSSIALSDAEAGSNHVNLFQSLSKSTTMATWDETAATVTMTLSPGAELFPFREYAVSFRLRNGFEGVNLTDIRIAAYTDDSCMHGCPMTQVSCGGTCSGEKLAQSTAVRVCEPGFIVKTIGQTYPWPGCDTYNGNDRNFIRVTLMPNVQIDDPAVIHLLNVAGPADAEVYSQVNLSGVVQISPNATIVPGVRYAAQNSSNVSFAWSDDQDKISLPVWAAFPLLAGQTYHFGFWVRNPVTSQAAAPIAIRVVGPLFNISAVRLEHDLTTLPIANRTFPGDAAALKIRAPEFVGRSIGQSNPFPDALNTITVTVVPNIAMGSKTDNSSGTIATHVSKITISGLVGSATSASTLNITQLSPANALLQTQVRWYQHNGSLVVEFQNQTVWRTSDDPIVFSFRLRNPAQCHTSPDVTIAGVSEGTNCPRIIPQAGMVKDTLSVPFAGCRACGVTGDRCNACQKCDEICDQQDAAPLKVHSPGFIVKSIQQSTTWPGATNRLNVTFAANIDLTDDTAIFISGLVGATAANGTMNLTDSNSSLFDNIEWNNYDKLLYLNVASGGISAGASRSFSFDLENPVSAQRSPLITIWALNAGSCKIPVSKCTMDRPTDANLQPLTVDSATFVVRAVGQSSPFASSSNTITITFATNQALERPTKVTVMGLMGSTMPSNLALQVTTVAGPHALVESSGIWTRSTGTLILSLRENVKSTPGQNYSISVDLMNPPSAQNAPLVSIAANGIDAVLVNSWPNQTLLPLGDQLPMKIIQPRIVKAKIRQSSALPDVRNVITVTMRMNALVSSRSKGSFTISGLLGARARTGSVALHALGSCNSTSCINVFKSSPTGSPGTAWWQGKERSDIADHVMQSVPEQSLVLYVANDIQAYYDYVFSFDVQNPTCNHDCSHVTIVTNGLDFVPASCNDDSSFIVSPVAQTLTVEQDRSTSSSCAGLVHAPGFNIKTISQCSSVNGDLNTLTVSLSPNVDIKQNALLSISGLTESGTDGPSLDLGGPDSTLFSEVSWSRAQGELKMKVRDSQGISMQQLVVFSFSLQNPVDGRYDSVTRQYLDSHQPSVGAESSNVIIGESPMSGRVLGGGDGPSLTVASISESTTVQRSYNSLMVLFESNVRIPAGSTMLLRGLTGTSMTATNITGMHAYHFSSSYNWVPESGDLELEIVTAIPQKTHRMFAFEVKNPSSSQPPPSVTMSVRCDPSTVGCFQGGFMSRNVNGTVLGAQTKATLIVRQIGQKTPYPGETNTLFVTLASNFEFRANGPDLAVLTLQGLSGAKVMPGTTQMELAGAHPFSSGCWNCECENANSCAVSGQRQLSSGGSAERLTFHLQADMAAGQKFIFAFNIINPLQQQTLDASRLEIGLGWKLASDDATSPYVTQSGPWPKMQQDLTTIPQDVYNARQGEAAPLTIRSAEFSTKLISQSSPYPCDSNWLCVTLVSSVPLTADKQSLIRLSYFEGASIPAGSGQISLYNTSSETGGGVPSLKSAINNGQTSKGFWTESAGRAELVVYAACRIEAGEEIKLCFKVSNPVAPTATRTSVRVFSSDSNTWQDMDVRGATNLGLPYETTDDLIPMFIRTPEFKSLQAFQSSPFPCDDNNITISLRSNVPFLPSCRTSLTVTGLLGSTTNSSHALNLQSGTSSSFAQQAVWNRSSGVLEVNVNQSTVAGAALVIMVTLKNQAQMQADASNIMVSASGVRIAAKQAGHDNAAPSRVISSMCQHVASDNRASCGAGDKKPMKIYAPSFLVANIRQDTAWPGATNKLSVEVVTNTDLRGDLGADLTISTVNTPPRAPAPFVVSSNRDGAVCGAGEDRFIMYSHENVFVRFGQMPESNAQHFVCVKVAFTYASRVYPWSYLNLTHLEVGADNTVAQCYNLSNGSNSSNCSNASVSSTGSLSTSSPVNCTARADLPWPYGTYFNASTNQSVNCTLPANASVANNQTVHVNFTEWYVDSTQWSYFNGDQWLSLTSLPSDLLVANVSSAGAITSMHAAAPGNHSFIAGIAAGFLADRSDLVFSSSSSVDVKIEIAGEFLTPPLIALTGTSATRFRTGSPNQTQPTWIVGSLPADIGPVSRASQPPVQHMATLLHAQAPTGLVVQANIPPVGRAAAAHEGGSSSTAVFLQVKADQTLTLGQRIEFSFHVLNPVEASQVAQTFRISAQSGCANLAAQDMVGQVLLVSAPEITVSKAGQSHPFPCTTNTITVTLQSNMHLRGVDGASLLLRNLDGAIVGSTGEMVHVLDASGGSRHQTLFVGSAGLWQEDVQGVNLTLASSKNIIAGLDYRFSFEIENPVVQAHGPGLDSMLKGAFSAARPQGRVRSDWHAPQLYVEATSSARSLFNRHSAVTVQRTMQLAQTSLNLCGSTVVGDAAPLYVYRPRFTMAAISQSSAFPCAANILSVTIAVNVPLCAKHCMAQITISNLEGAVVQSGALALQASADAGHETDKDTFAASPGGALGYGNWTDNSLILYLTCCLECNKEYRFAFPVTNQNCGRSPTGVVIQSTNVDSQVAIPPTTMNTTQNHLPLGGSKATLDILQPRFTVKNIGQSTSAPCARNTITATIGTNVPMAAGTYITLKGLTQSQTNSSSALAITSDLSSNVSCLNTTGTWQHDTGSLVVQVSGNSCYENETWVDFAGNGCAAYRDNVSMCQTAAQRVVPVGNVSAHPNFDPNGQSAAVECCACSGSWPRRGHVWGCTFSFSLDNPAKELTGTVPQVEAVVCTSCNLTSNRMIGKVMVVSPLNFSATIWQSSPFPCDINTITVSLVHYSVPVLTLCNPSVTITGLRNAIASDGAINVRDLLNSNNVQNGSWSTSDVTLSGQTETEGMLTLQLANFISGGNSTGFKISFEVVNPNFAQAAPDVRIQAHIMDDRRTHPVSITSNEQTMTARSMIPPRRTQYDFVTGQNGEPVPFQTPANSSQLSSMVKNESGVLQVGDISAVDFTGKAVADWWYTCRSTDVQGNCVKFADNGNDRQALFVRQIFFTKRSIAQSNAEPCSHLTMTVTLETSVPLLTRCEPTVTIRGLQQAVELEPAVVNVSQAVNVSDFAVQALGASTSNTVNQFSMLSFDRLAGTMVLSVINNTVAGVPYVISFKLRHSAEPSDGVSAVMVMEALRTNDGVQRSQLAKLASHSVGLAFESGSASGAGDKWLSTHTLNFPQGDAKPMKVKTLQYTGHAGQTSVFPCANNTVWVNLDAVDLQVL